MKKILLGYALLLIFSSSFCQKIILQKTFSDALAKARAENKLVFLSITAPLPPMAARPEHAKFESGINNQDVVKFYNQRFINYAVEITDTASSSLKRKFGTTIYPAYLFVDGKGNLVYKEIYNSPLAEKYLTMANKALAEASSGKTLSDYEAKYQQGFASADFLKAYITKREDMGIYDNAKLIDEYTELLTVKSFQNYNEVLFILKAGPTADSRTYSLCYTNQKITDSIYKHEPSPLRSAINARIAGNTLSKAIREKNQGIAQAAANFNLRRWGKDYRTGSKQSQQTMLDYYRAVKDTASFYRTATYFYDGYYMNISADSAKKFDDKRLEILRKNAMANAKSDTIRTVIRKDTVKRTIIRTSGIVRAGSTFNIADDGSISNGVSSSTASALNNAAYEFYTMGTRNQNTLTKAMLWSKRAIELNPLPPYYDTLAHILYRLGFYEEAKSAQSKAIELSQSQTKEVTDRYKAELNKIKSRQL